MNNQSFLRFSEEISNFSETTHLPEPFHTQKITISTVSTRRHARSTRAVLVQHKEAPLYQQQHKGAG